MTQITINVANKDIATCLKKMFKAMDGVTIVKSQKKSGIDCAIEEVAKGKVTHFDSAESMFKSLGI